MLCKNCNQRYADFPEEDFKFVPPHGKLKMFFSRITFNLIKRNGFYPKDENADWRRAEKFYSDEWELCSNECKDWWDNLNYLQRSTKEIKNHEKRIEDLKEEIKELKADIEFCRRFECI